MPWAQLLVNSILFPFTLFHNSCFSFTLPNQEASRYNLSLHRQCTLHFSHSEEKNRSYSMWQTRMSYATSSQAKFISLINHKRLVWIIRTSLTLWCCVTKYTRFHNSCQPHKKNQVCPNDPMDFSLKPVISRLWPRLNFCQLEISLLLSTCLKMTLQSSLSITSFAFRTAIKNCDLVTFMTGIAFLFYEFCSNILLLWRTKS